MHKVIFGLIKKIASAFLSFIAEVWSGSTGELLDEICPYVNEVVRNMENISIFVKQNLKAKTPEEMAEALRRKYGYSQIDTEFCEQLIAEIEGKADLLEFKTAKVNMTMRILKDRLAYEKVSFVENVVMLSIQLAVTRMNNKDNLD